MSNNITKSVIYTAEQKLKDYSERCSKFMDLSTKFCDVDNSDINEIFVIRELECSLKRVFNNGTTKDGGRFYGADYQGLSEEKRSNIMIDGQPTVELDYSSLHIMILYHMKGHVFEGDAYSLPEIEDELKSMLADEDMLRPIIKKALNTIINASSIVNAKESMKKELDKKNLLKSRGNISNFCNKLINAIIDKHSAIKEYFFTKKGIKLQRLDSDIAFNIVEELMQKGILVLPIHDSFIVQKCYEKELRDAMFEHYKAMFKFSPIIK